ncbi:hypothetical protein V2J09_006699 [Rumex salicifolius]
MGYQQVLYRIGTRCSQVLGTSLSMSTVYHPQSDGQTEHVNKCLEAYLHAMTVAKPKQWLRWLSLEEWWYNTNYHTTLKMSPFQILYGYPPLQLGQAQSRMKSIADAKLALRKCFKLSSKYCGPFQVIA